MLKGIRVKLFRQKPKVDPRSKELTDSLVKMLQDKGMTDKEHQAVCTKDILNHTITYFKKITNGGSVDAEVVKFIDAAKTSLEEYGISDNSAKEEIILAYLEQMHKTMGVAHG